MSRRSPACAATIPAATYEDVNEDSCIFCRILAGLEPGHFIYRDAAVAAILTIGPINPGHLMVVPTRHAASLAELQEAENLAIFSLAPKLAAALRRSDLRCEGVNYWMADGEAAFQDVFHFHLHIIPRFSGDGFKVSHPATSRPRRGKLDEVARLLRLAL